MSSSKKSFWSRSNAETVEDTSRKSSRLDKRRDSFEDFEAKTIDAWDDGDDDLLKMVGVMKQTSLSQQQQRNSLTTGSGILSNHSRTNIGGENENKKFDKGAKVSQSFSQVASSSAPSTPARLRGHRLGFGPTSENSSQQSTDPARMTMHGTFSPLIDQHDVSKIEKFKILFDAPNLNLDELQTLCWSGIPVQFRSTAWKLLSGYMPTILERRDSTMERKRNEYQNLVQQYYDTRHQEIHQETFRQIHIDVPRTCPLIPIFQQDLVQELFERVLYIWAIRHPASGYVQGINDLITPFFIVFLNDYVKADSDVQNCVVAELPEACRQRLEADCFWCFSKLLDGIQDNYTFAQPGIQTRINSLKELVGRIDKQLHSHLESHHIEYLQFAFRWMNNLLMREMPLHCVIRLWDTYLAEPNGFASFHLYVCASFLTRFSSELQQERDFHGLMLLLQNLPTHHWTNKEIGLILAEAYRLKYMFADAPNHYRADTGVVGNPPSASSSSRLS